MAPERLQGNPDDEDGRVDVYSLACSLYECLTGQPPFRGTDYPSLIAAHLNSPPPKPSAARPHVPAQLDMVIAKGLAKDPNDRYATTVELANDARDAITGSMSQSATILASPLPGASPRPSRGRRPGRRARAALLTGGIAVVAVALGVVLFGGSRSTHEAAPPAPTPRPSQRVLPFTGLVKSTGVVVDSAGNVYVADFGNRRVVKLATGTSGEEVLPFAGLNDPSGVAVGPGGDVYVTDHGTEQVVKLAAGSSSQEVLPFTGLNAPSCVAVDAAGNVYVTDDPQRTLKLPVE